MGRAEGRTGEAVWEILILILDRRRLLPLARCRQASSLLRAHIHASAARPCPRILRAHALTPPPPRVTPCDASSIPQPRVPRPTSLKVHPGPEGAHTAWHRGVMVRRDPSVSATSGRTMGTCVRMSSESPSLGDSSVGNAAQVWRNDGA